MAGLFSSFGVGRSGLEAQQIALQTIGQNIANANTEGYTRQEAILESNRPQNLVYAQIGTGVHVAEIRRVIDQQLEGRLRDSFSSLGSFQAQDTTLQQLEALFNELTNSDLSSAMSQFFDSLEDLSLHPDDPSARSVVLEQGQALTDSIRFLATGVNRVREQVNSEITTAVSDINGMIKQIAQLNTAIVQAENAGGNPGSANDLRDQRGVLLKQLSEMLDVRVVENPTGAVSVLAGSDFLVYGQSYYDLKVTESVDRNVTIATVEFAQDGQDLAIRGGKLKGLIDSRDTIATEFVDDLSTLASTLIFEFNKIHASGRGLTAFTDLTSAESVTQPSRTLNAAGLDFAPVNGSFEINIENKNTGEVKTINIEIDLDGFNGDDTTLDSLVAEINAEAAAAFSGSLTASVTGTNRLRLAAGSDYNYTFANDSSGALSALGLNTFFAGHNAMTIAISDEIAADTNRIAAARPNPPGSFLPGDNTNALLLIALRDTKLLSGSSTTLDGFYQGSIGSLAVQTQTISGRMANQEVLHNQLLNKREQVSGVSLDEETINLLAAQRAFQASARFISVIDELLNTLINAT